MMWYVDEGDEQDTWSAMDINSVYLTWLLLLLLLLFVACTHYINTLAKG